MRMLVPIVLLRYAIAAAHSARILRWPAQMCNSRSTAERQGAAMSKQVSVADNAQLLFELRAVRRMSAVQEDQGYMRRLLPTA